MDLSDLLPYPVYIEWSGQYIELKPFSLRSITWAERFFFKENEPGFERMRKILGNPNDKQLMLNTLIDIVYHLGESGFKEIAIKNPVEFKNLVNKQDNIPTVLNEFQKGVEKVLINSFPQKKEEPEMTGGAIFQFLKGKAAQQEEYEVKTNWSEVYTRFFIAGGMLIDDFYNLTIRQVAMISEEIGFQKQDDFFNEYRMHASLHGADPKKIKNPKRRAG